MKDLFEQLYLPGLPGFLEILILAVLFYYLIVFFRGTRGVQVLIGLLLFSLAFFLTSLFRMDTLHWLLMRLSGYFVIAFVVIFQPEIRRFLAELGKRHFLRGGGTDRAAVDAIVQAVLLLADRKIGALIAVEQEIGTRTVQESGTWIDSALTPELLASIFFPHTPLHDGGVVVKDGRILAAGCVFPLSMREELSKTLGTRHRAAIGLTEETDAVVIVVSEETGTISVAYKGRLTRGLDEEKLKRLLSALLLRKPGDRGIGWFRGGGRPKPSAKDTLVARLLDIEQNGTNAV
jgi:diadenylate cyclase